MQSNGDLNLVRKHIMTSQSESHYYIILKNDSKMYLWIL